MNRPSANPSYPQFEDDEKQEAARFLVCDIDARPMIRGIQEISRLEAWEDVAEELEGLGDQQRALRQRREALEGEDVDADEAFSAASELSAATDGGSAAVADGGAVVDDDRDDENDGDQDVMEYEDAAERESKYQDARSIAKMFDDPEQVRGKLQEEFDRDVRRPHVVDALEDRLEVLSE